MTPAMHELLKQALDLMQPQIQTILSDLKPHFVFFDFAQHWLPTLCSPLGIKTVNFSVFSAISGAYIIVPARLIGVETDEPTVEDLKKPPCGFPETSVTSLKTFQARDLTYVFKSFDGSPAVYYRGNDCLQNCSVNVFKTCNEMEGPYIDFMKTQFQKQVLLCGPIVPDPPSGVLDEKWANWLAQHPPKSVVFAPSAAKRFSKMIKAMMNDCQLVLLPFKGDQFLNSKLVAGDLKAGVEVSRRDEDGYFSMEDIKKAVETVMVDVDKEPGISIRKNHMKWKEFLLNSEIQGKFISDLVEEMTAML
ncbi:Anthocyanidin 3-O-glucosyltransferase [Hibiscus syriacus]|uniref:Anthocyanidin 3-O-glucosyltransferase n=1 Tax=Hibiscus syriacus TaxID=106335 RepID=A0A6A2XH74_HIBSY|nr:Anthocyanidin 3-O-glucosyltransferase [Hibiscus syriacus]